MSSVIALEPLLDAVGSRPAVVTVIDTYLEDAPGRLLALKRALAANDAARVALEAHALAGGAKHLGATALVTAAFVVERAARTPTAPGGEAIATLERAYAAVEEALRAARAGLVAAS